MKVFDETRPHLLKGTYSGAWGIGVSERPGIHVLIAGSNTAYTGFKSLEEAEAFKGEIDDHLMPSVVDRRDETAEVKRLEAKRLANLPKVEPEDEPPALSF